MKIFSIYTKKSTVNSFDDVVAVQKSFNIWATIFNFWWALYKGQFFIALMIFLVLTLLNQLYVVEMVNYYALSLMTIFVLLVIGVESGDWIESGLRCKDYLHRDIIFAKDTCDAKYQYLKNISEV